MKILVFDTEFVNLEKPFIYNLGYVVFDLESKQVILRREFIVDQVWYNYELFTTAYYASKRDNYIKQLKGRKILLKKWGYITQQLIRDIETFEDELQGYAYNSSADTRAFKFMCEWYKVINPLELIEVYDILPYVHKCMAFTKEYQDFCDLHQCYTESGNYSTTAETAYKFITQNADFIEEHTALADSEIELQILLYCVENGAKFGCAYKKYNSIPNTKPKQLIIQTDNEIVKFDYKKRINKKDKIILKN